MKECTNCQHGKWAMQRPIMFPAEGICVTCTSIKDGEVHYPSNWEPQAMTNADRIRAMSDEELADKFTDVAYEAHGRWYEPDGKTYHSLSADAKKAWLNWLRQPVKDGEDE